MTNMTEREKYLRSVRITHTPIGQEYMWDSLLDVNYRMVRHNLECKLNVLSNPKLFPRADRRSLEASVGDHQEFLALYPEG
jgi:hypothetical protein